MHTPIKSFDDFKSELIAKPELQKQFKDDPVQAVKQITQQSPLDTDKWSYRIIVLALDITILSVVTGVMILIGAGKITDDKQVPTIFTAIGSTAFGALAGLLAPAPKRK